MNNPSYYDYEVGKPLYRTPDGVVAGIYDKRVNDAIKNRQLLRIKCDGIEEVFLPKWIKKNCRTFKKVYLRENDPMMEYEVFLKRKTADQKEAEMCKTYLS